MSDIRFLVTVDSKKGQAAIKELDKNIGGLEKATKKATPSIAGMWKQMAAGVVAAQGIIGSFKGVINFMQGSIEAAGKQEEAIKQLETRLKSTGGAAGLVKEELLAMASGLQKVTAYGDETIIGAENLLLTFTKIGKNVFPQALETILDMSTALGQDLKSSAIQVGKALQDPILGVTALRRVGVNFNEQQAEQIKLLVESGKMFEAQKFILQELSTEFGGSARASVETYQGAIKQLRNTYFDLRERIGEVVTKNESIRKSIQATNETIRNVIDAGYLEEYIEYFKRYAKIAILLNPHLMVMTIQAKTMGLAIDALTEKIERDADAKRRMMVIDEGILEVYKQFKKPFEGFTKIIETALPKTRQLGTDFKAAREEYVLFMEAVGESTDNWAKLMFWGEERNRIQRESGETAKKSASQELSAMDKVATAMSWIGGFSKETAIAQAIINTYQGVSKTIAMLGMPWAIPFIALALATGMEQVTAIKDQSIPRADVGAYLTQDTLVQAHRGETILPVERSPIIREIREAGGGTNIYMTFNVQRLNDSEIYRVKEKLHRMIKGEMRRYG